MQRRGFLSMIGLAATALLVFAGPAESAPKEATVTLTISGMT